MAHFNLRKKPRISYFEPEEPGFDEYVYCDECKDFVYEYCALHGRLLVIPDDKVPAVSPFPSFVPLSALTIPHQFLHIARSNIPGAGLGVFSSLTLPEGVRFGPYRGVVTQCRDSNYGWQVYDKNRKPSYVLDAEDANKSNWMRFVNCSRHRSEQNLIAFQYQGHIYYRTLRIIPRFSELLVYYGREFALDLGINVFAYNKRRRSRAVRPQAITDVPPSILTDAQANKDIGGKNKDATSPVATNKITRVGTNKQKKFVVQQKKSESNQETQNNPPSKSSQQAKTKQAKADQAKAKQAKADEVKIKKTITNQATAGQAKPDHTLTKYADIIATKISENGANSDRSSTLSKVHPLSGVMQCKHCAYTTLVATALERHERLHDETRPHRCLICDKRYTKSGMLKDHMRRHTGDKPYKCTVCDKGFTSSDLEKHMRIHTNERPYKCTVCEGGFTQSVNLKSHMRIHTNERPYKCTVCERGFTVSGNLESHMRIHTNERPYKCTVCERGFTTSGNLKLHMRIHTGEKPYQCSVCQVSFARSHCLKSHIKTHTVKRAA